MKSRLFIAIASICLFACQKNNEIKTDFWRGEFQLSDSILLPINFKLYNDSLVIYNGNEHIQINEIEHRGDTFIYHLPVFDNAFEVVLNDGHMTGYWKRYDLDHYSIPFEAWSNDSLRFKYDAIPQVKLEKRYQVKFRVGKENEELAIGEFNQLPDGKLLGTFLTETGDYRFLEGRVAGNHMALSSFDGVHAYVFNGMVDESGVLRGWHHSGNNYAEPFIAWPNDTFQLPDPKALTYLKEGYESIEFKAKSITGADFVYQKDSYSGKVVIVQLMGSWCPNCMDETRFLAPLYNKYHRSGLEIIGLSFERSPDFEKAQAAMLKMQRDLNIPYPMIFGGKASSEGINSMLPMIAHFMSYPTSIIIDKKGKVRTIHTGFNGPGTSEYEKYAEETEDFIINLLNE